MAVADQIVDSSINNNNSNNRDIDGDFKPVNEVLEPLKARALQPNPFSA